MRKMADNLKGSIPHISLGISRLTIVTLVFAMWVIYNKVNNNIEQTDTNTRTNVDLMNIVVRMDKNIAVMGESITTIKKNIDSLKSVVEK